MANCSTKTATKELAKTPAKKESKTAAKGDVNKQPAHLDELEPDVSLLERLLDTENDDNIFLFNEDGDEIELEQIAVVSQETGVYAIMHPVSAADDEAVVFKIETDDEESVTVVEDEKLADEILDLYHKQAGI